MGSVGLAMIVRDCEETLGVCLKSVEGLFDQTVVVDTGSVDGTVGVARAFGAEIFHFQWINDFSAARNYSFEQLKTDYAFWMDGDDCLVGREYFDEMVRKCEDLRLDGVVLEYLYAFDAVGERWLAELEPAILARSISSDHVSQKLRWPRCVTTQWRERLVRRDPAWTWRYEVHEALPAVGRRLGKYDRVKMVHRRHVRTTPVPSRRNLEILLSIPEGRRDERHWFYLGMEYAQHRDVEAAIAAFEQYLPLGTVEDERYLAHHFLGDLYRYKGEPLRSISYDLLAVALRPYWRDAYAGLLETYAKQEDWPKVVYYGARCKQAEIPDTPFAYNPLHEEVGWVGDYVRGLCAVGQYEEALEESERALSIIPEDVARQQNVDVLSTFLNVQRGQERIADVVEFFLRHDDAETAAVLLSRLAPELRAHPRIQEFCGMVDRLCGQAAGGWVLPDQLKIDPVCPPLTEDQVATFWWSDPRVRRLREFLAARPEVRSVLQVGGPLELRRMYVDLGLRTERAERVEQIGGSWDVVILWSCLERVKHPDDLVARARAVVGPGGWLLACVPNGPQTKGLGPPAPERLRLRAYSVDAFRQVMGTVRMPEGVGGWSADAGDLWLEVPMPMLPGRSKSLAIVCPLPLEPWGPWSLDHGIGGSEEAVVRLSRAFARRGHRVTVYGTGWVGVDHFVPGVENLPVYAKMQDYAASDLLIGWRYPEVFVNQFRPFEAEWRALWLHDTVERARVEAVAPALDAIWSISDYHAGLYSGVPGVYKGRNGIDPWEFEVTDPPERNPAKVVYLSTPFRGLGELLYEHWPEIKRRVPEAELHAYYGWESADRLGVTATPEGGKFKQTVMELCQQPGVVWHGRVGQPELYREILSAGVWAYPSNHREESAISGFLAQAGGAWPVVYPMGALPQTCVFGWKVTGLEFVGAVVDAIRTEAGRDRMMGWARQWLTWDDVAGLWERLWLGRAA